MNDIEAEGAGVVTTDDWRVALEKVVPCCLVLKVTQTRACDTEPASSAYATGFIVDRARGIVLTNRHVVTPGPIVAEAIFLNREELPVYPLYYDPIHDFAFLRFDPSKLQFMEAGEVPLAPEAAAVGLDIRVVGNDSGEKLSILAGTLARLDRDAPVYGRKGYNDFNTFYLQAASGTKGGSSGSPVIDHLGRAVGLNAGGKNKAASAYYLPLERVARVLSIIQGHWPTGGGSLSPTWSARRVSRGDLQATFVFKGFDEVRRLGLQTETEAAVRAAPGRSHGAPGVSAGGCLTVGMLVVDSVVPGSPCGSVLEPGDVLVSLDGSIVTHFLHLEELLDERVGQVVELRLERGGAPYTARVEVTDLHQVTPSSLLEVAGGAVHALSYQQARNNRAVVGQVYVAEPGYMLGKAGIPKHAIITGLDGKPTPDLEAFAAVLRSLPHRARVPLEFYTFQERHRKKNALMQVDRQWYGAPLLWVRDDAVGAWHPTADYPRGVVDAGTPPAITPPEVSCNESSEAGEAGGVAAAEGGKQEVEAMQVDVSHAPAPAAAAATAVVEESSPAKGRSTRSSRQAGTPTPSPVVGKASAGSKRGVAGRSPAKEAAAAGPGRSPLGKAEPQLSQEEYEERMRACMCLLEVDIPLVALSDGVHSRSFAGNGVVVHHSDTFGLVLVDRNTVAIGPCDVNLSFGAHPAEVPGTVRFLHPLHNFALVSYNPAELPAEARRKVAAAPLLPAPALARGDSVRLVGLTRYLRLMTRTSIVTSATSALTIPSAEVPRFRAVHEEVVKLDQDFGASFSGVLTDDQARIRALWGSYAEQVEKEEREWCAGLPAHVVEPWVNHVLQLQAAGGLAPPPSVWALDAELEAVLLSKAAQFGLPPAWVSRLDELDPERRQVLRVRSTVANSAAAAVLQSGDMLLAIDGQPLTSFADVEALVKGARWPGAQQDAVGGSSARRQQKAGRPAKRAKVGSSSAMATVEEHAAEVEAGTSTPEPGGAVVAAGAASSHAAGVEQQSAAAGAGTAEPGPAGALVAPAVPAASAAPTVTVTIFRGGQVLDLPLLLGVEDGLGTDRLVHWCGAQLQAPHRAVRELGYLPPNGGGVYISRWHHGSPAHRYGLYALHWVEEVNGVPVKDLDGFLEVVGRLKDGDFARIKMCHLETQTKVLTLKLDLKYWPTWELRLDPLTARWQRHHISPLSWEDAAAA